MARRQKFDYFDAFARISDFGVQYATELVAFLEEGLAKTERGEALDTEAAIKRYEVLHKLETDSDEVAHDIISSLISEFVPPIEREDIMALTEELDTVVDDIDEILQYMYMYNVNEVQPEAVKMAHIVKKATIAVHNVCLELHHLKKPGALKPHIVDINDCEEEGDNVYIQSMHNLYSGELDHMAAHGWGNVLTCMEKCCDACEDVADTLVTVIMKNN